jgi:DNA polymerase phi
VSLSPSSVRDENKKNKKPSGEAEEANEDEDEQEDDDEDDDDEDEGEIDEDLKNAVLKALNSVGAAEESEEEPDLDDETMLKLDETIAQAFRMRKTNKQHQNDVMQYKLRALDFIQELFKSNHRLDLITVRIQNMIKVN